MTTITVTHLFVVNKSPSGTVWMMLCRLKIVPTRPNIQIISYYFGVRGNARHARVASTTPGEDSNSQKLDAKRIDVRCASHSL